MVKKTGSALLLCVVVILMYWFDEYELPINTTQTKPHALKNYAIARKIFWQKIYPRSARTLYCGYDFSKNKRKKVNIEHVFPMSWVKNALQCETPQQCRKSSTMFNKIEADLHNLYPALQKINTIRSSMAFGEIQGERPVKGVTCDFEVDFYQRRVEPRKQARGRIARAMLYMAYRYQSQGLRLYPKQARLLRTWHQRYPANEAEKKRNRQIALIQGNDNPFINEPRQIQQWLSEW